MKIGLLAGVSGLAMSAAVLAAPQFADFRAMGANDLPVNPNLNRLAPGSVSVSGPIDVGVTVQRGNAGERGVLVSFTDNAENLNVFPAVLNLQVGNAVWSDGSITGTNRWLGTTAAGRTAFAVSDAIAGNATKKARLMATTAQTPDQFFFGLRYEFLRSNAPLVRYGFEADVGQPARVEHDMYVSSIATMWTSEPIYVTSGFIVSRLLWGGTCVEGCPDIGLPTGSLPGVYVLGINPNSFLTGIFRTCQWIGSAPTGQSANTDVVMQTGAWIRVRHDITAQGNVESSLDYNDSTGFHMCYSDTFLTGTKLDSLGANGSYEIANDAAYYDNFLGSGVEIVLPTPPTDLVCGPSGYSDDIQWLNAGVLKDQSDLWFDALSSKANVDVSAGDKFIRQTNQFSDDKTREEFTRTMPEVSATPGNPWTFCEETRVSSGNVTPRAIALVSFLDNSFVTRVTLGNFDPNAAPPYQGRVFIQHNPNYDPIDDEDTVDPYLPGPNGNGGVPVTGGAATIGDPAFDYYDTGVAVAAGNTAAAARIVCIEVADNDAMTVTYGATTLVGGGSGVVLPAFAHSLNEVRHESGNTLNGNNNSYFADDLTLACASLPQVVLPPLTLVYLDNLQWANLNVTIDANDDDGNPQTAFRWASAPNTPVVDLGAKSFVLKMENVFADTTQVQGDFTLFTQASTQVPNVTVSGTRGYAVGGRYKMTDGLTTRAWMVAEADIIPGLFRSNAWILYSAGTGTLWYLTPDPVDPINNDAIWVDSGTSLAAMGVSLNQWFTLTTHYNLNGTFIWKINAKILTDSGSAVVRANPLQSTDGGLHNNLDRLFLLGGDDEAVPAGSILYADNIRAWALPCLGDTNDDGAVNFADINNILGQFNQPVAGTMPPNVAPDANNDGVADDAIVSFADLNAALGQFNNPCN